MPIEVRSDGENLIFEDYLKRKITIKHTDYLDLISAEERQQIRPALEACLSEPSEVWWNIEQIDGIKYTYFKYIKVYSNLVFIALVLLDDRLNFSLNNFYGYGEHEFDLAEQERKGQLIISNLR